MTSETKQEIRPAEEPGNVRPFVARADVWTQERKDLVRRSVCPPGVTDDEFELFVEQCKRSGLDPLLRECFCVPRRANAGTRERPNWITRHEFQPSESGMLARAERFPDFRGISASAVFAEDEILIDAGSQSVVHRFNPTRRKGPIVGAWARVVRDGMTPIVVWLDFDGYAQTTPLWAKIPTTMIEKCARVGALRKAYPEAFGGLYIREEMPPDEQPAADPMAGRETCQRCRKLYALPGRATCEPCGAQLEREKAEALAALEREKAEKVGTSAATEAQASRTAQVREQVKAKAAGAKGPTARFGGPGFVGKPLASLSLAQLRALFKMGEENLHRDPKAEWAPRVEANLLEINAAIAEAEMQEQANRKPDPDPGDRQGPGSREPGEDDGGDDVPF